MSAPPRQAASMSSISAGGCCRSASMRRTMSPRARSIPAVSAASLPKLRDSATLRARFDRWEIVVVNDGSSDATEIALAPWLARGGVRYVALSRNFGKEAALTAGIDRARGDIVLLMDADLQHPPALIDDMLAAWRGGADMVYTVRTSRDDESWLKKFGTRWF